MKTLPAMSMGLTSREISGDQALSAANARADLLDAADARNLAAARCCQSPWDAHAE
jgi:hypothetical protein